MIKKYIRRGTQIYAERIYLRTEEDRKNLYESMRFKTSVLDLPLGRYYYIYYNNGTPIGWADKAAFEFLFIEATNDK